MAAVLQLVVLTLLARGLSPANFAFVSSVNVALMVLVALNGFGMLRQISFRRSVNPQDELLAPLYGRRLNYTYASAVLWVVGTVGLYVAFDDSRWLALVPASIWLVAEQNTQVWNTIAVADGRARDLMTSFCLRRAPVIAFLAVALVEGMDVIWAWSVGIAVGAVAAYVGQYRRQEHWARAVLPRRHKVKIPLDLGYWWTQVGEWSRDLDVPLLTAFVDPVVAGIYALPARFVRPMNMVTLATASVAFPQLSRRQHIWRHQVLLGAVLGSAPTAVMALCLFLVAPLLPVIAGSDYADSVGTMQVICLATALWGVCSMFSIFLQSRASPAAARASGATIMIFNGVQLAGVVLGGILGGSSGAAWACVFGQALMVLTLALLSLRYSAPRSYAVAEASFGPASAVSDR